MYIKKAGDGVRTRHPQTFQGQREPQLWLDLDEERLGFSAYDAVNALLNDDSAVAVAESRAELGTIVINPLVPTDNEAGLGRSWLKCLFQA